MSDRAGMGRGILKSKPSNCLNINWDVGINLSIKGIYLSIKRILPVSKTILSQVIYGGVRKWMEEKGFTR